MKNRDCNLVRDLLPNYVENLTNDDTNLFIENHLKECSECSNILSAMKNGENKNEEIKSKKFVKFSKKFRKKYKLWKSIVLIIILLFFVHFIRNFIILTSQYKHMEEHINMNNYHVRRYLYFLDNIILENVYYKDGKALYIACISYTNHFDDTTTVPVRDYIEFYDDKHYTYSTDPVSKIKYYHVSDYDYTHDYNITLASDKPSLLSFILQSAFCRIDSTRCNGVDCYRIISNIDGYNQYSYFDKKTGFPVRGSNPVTLDNDQKYLGTCDLFIEFGTVTDEDLQVPNRNEYKTYDEVKDLLMNASLKKDIDNNELELVKSDLQYMIDENIEINPEYYEKYKYLLEE